MSGERQVKVLYDERTIAERLIRTIAEELAIPVSVQYSNLLRDGEPCGGNRSANQAGARRAGGN